MAPYTPDLSRAGGPIPFTTFGADQFKNHLGGDDPHGYCQPTGPTRAIHSPFPFQIVQSAGLTTFLFEIDHTFRRIFTDGRGHPHDLDHTWYGDSVGKYEGDTLSADTIGLSIRAGFLKRFDNVQLVAVLMTGRVEPAPVAEADGIGA